GIDHASLAAKNPRLVSIHVSSWGIGDPRNVYPPIGNLVAADMGILWEQPGWRDGPIFLGFPMMDYGLALCIVIGGLSAVVARDRTGRGQLVDASMYDSALAQLSINWCTVENSSALMTELSRERDGYYDGKQGRRSMLGIFKCADGEFIQFHT